MHVELNLDRLRFDSLGEPGAFYADLKIRKIGTVLNSIPDRTLVAIKSRFGNFRVNRYHALGQGTLIQARSMVDCSV